MIYNWKTGEEIQENYCLYAHVNPINNKVYIGITCNYKQRWSRKEISYKHCPKIYSAFKKYGWDTFIHVILFDGLTKEEAEEKEKKWIAAYKSINMSYNISDGGEGVSGVKYSEERRKKISEQLSGRVCSSETRKRISEATRGKKTIKIYAFDIKTKTMVCSFSSVRVAAKVVGVPHTNISSAAKGKVPSAGGYIWSYISHIDENNPLYNKIRNSTVYCYNFNGEYVCKYSSAKEAAEHVDGFKNTILDCCNGRKLSYKGFIWRHNLETIDKNIIERVNKRKRL